MTLIENIKKYFVSRKKLWIISGIEFFWIIICAFIPFKFTFIFASIVAFIWYCVFKYKVIIKSEFEDSWIKVNNFYYKDWLLNIAFVLSVFFSFYFYLCLLARGFL